DRERWAREYLLHFVSQARKRSEDMRKKFVDPFLKYIE
ncbi:MAG: HincII family type II restriction endonuclease, partial [Kiritimatiellae bacterium]|nr:HincII family type II restriction endonuclease [Kiritimatiellia bacterium]